jgi:hypothetical protein
VQPGDEELSFSESAAEFRGLAKGPGDLSTNALDLSNFGQ